MGQSLTAIEIADRPLLQLHLEPESPLEVSELTGALAAIARQYAAFVEKDGTLGRGADAKLLVLSVSPGSIDIAFLPNLHEVAGLLVTALTNSLILIEVWLAVIWAGCVAVPAHVGLELGCGQGGAVAQMA